MGKMRGWLCVCAVLCGNELGFLSDERNPIYTSGRENSLRRGLPRLRVFVVPLTFRRFALGSTGSDSGSSSGSGAAPALDPDRDGASASAIAAPLSGTRGGE